MHSIALSGIRESLGMVWTRYPHRISPHTKAQNLGTKWHQKRHQKASTVQSNTRSNETRYPIVSSASEVLARMCRRTNRLRMIQRCSVNPVANLNFSAEKKLNYGLFPVEFMFAELAVMPYALYERANSRSGLISFLSAARRASTYLRRKSRCTAMSAPPQVNTGMFCFFASTSAMSLPWRPLPLAKG